MNSGTISCGFGCDIFFLSSSFSSRSPGGCAGMHHTGLPSVSMWPLGCSVGALQLAARSQFAIRTGIPLFSSLSPLTSHGPGMSSEIQISSQTMIQQAAKLSKMTKKKKKKKKRTALCWPMKLNLRSSKIRNYLIIKILRIHV